MTRHVPVVVFLMSGALLCPVFAQRPRRTARPIVPPHNNAQLGLGYVDAGPPIQANDGSGLAPGVTLGPPTQELWHAEWGSAQIVYFHAGGGGTFPQSCQVIFHGDGNSGIYWGITSPDWMANDAARASQLTFLERGSGKLGGDTPPLDITYELSQDGGHTWHHGQWAGEAQGSSWGYWWLINGGNAGKSTWILRVTTAPTGRQQAGRYSLVAELATRPIL